MKPIDQTIYENVKPDDVQANKNEGAVASVFEDDNDRSNFKKRAAMLAGSMLGGSALGAGIAYALIDPPKPTPDVKDTILDESADKSFADAFDDARKQLGPGGAFRWQGKVYSTYTEEEWNAMSKEEQQAYYDKVKPLMSDEELDPKKYATIEYTNNTVRTEEHVNVTRHDNYDITSEEVTDLHGRSVIMAKGSHNGRSAVFIDIDKDGKYDVMIEDVNGDNKLQENEYIDIADKNVGVGNRELLTEGIKPVADKYVIIEEIETEINGHKVIAAKAEHNGKRAVLIDANHDGVYDVAVEDRNGDEEITEDEYHDISNSNIRVQDQSLINGEGGGSAQYISQSDPVVEIDPNDEKLYNGTIATTGTVDGKNALIIDVNRDGTYDVAYVDRDGDNNFEGAERKPVNIVSAGARVHNTDLVDKNTTDTGLDHQDDNTPDYTNSLPSQQTNNAEGTVEVTVGNDSQPTYTAMGDSTTETPTDDTANHYNAMNYVNEDQPFEGATDTANEYSALS
jgi:hypothetical protein